MGRGNRAQQAQHGGKGRGQSQEQSQSQEDKAQCGEVDTGRRGRPLKLTPKQRKNMERNTRLQMRKDRQRCAYGDAQWKDDWSKFVLQLKAIGLTIKDVAGDGNCLFRAIADQMEGDPSLHFTYRSNICNFIEDNREDYEPFVEDDEPFDKYLKRMRTAATWGGQMEIQAFSMFYQVNVTIHQLDSPRWDIKNFGPEVRTIHLSYHNGQHYCSVRKFGDPSINKREMPPLIDIQSSKVPKSDELKGGKNKHFKQQPQSTIQKPPHTTTLTPINQSSITPEEAEVMEVTGCKNREYIRNLLIDNWGDTCAVIEFILMMGEDAKNYEEEYMMEKIKEKLCREAEKAKREEEERNHREREREREKQQKLHQAKQTPTGDNFHYFGYNNDTDYFNETESYVGNCDYSYLDYEFRNNIASATDYPDPEDYDGYNFVEHGKPADETNSTTTKISDTKEVEEKKYARSSITLSSPRNYQKPKKNQTHTEPEVPFVHPKLAKFANQNLSNKERKELAKTASDQYISPQAQKGNKKGKAAGNNEEWVGLVQDLGSMQI